MTDFNAAADFARRATERNKDIAALGEALKEIGSIEQARAERQAALDAVIEERRVIDEQMAAAKSEHAAFLASRAEDLSKHQDAADAIRDDALAAADEIKARAASAAEDAIKAANAEVARIQSAHADTMRVANEELAGVRAELETAKRDLDAANTDRDAVAKSIQDMRVLARNALGPN